MLHLRNGRFLILVGLLAVGMLLAALHQQADRRGQTFFVDSAIRTVLSPLQSAVHAVVGVGSGIEGSLRTRSRLQSENKRLRGEVLRLHAETAKLREEHAENLRLRSSLQFKKSYPGRLLSAQIIGRGASRWHQTITIDRGWRDGVHRADPVTTPRGLVGQVMDLSAGVSQVLLLTDQSSGVGAVVQRSRVAGVCQGQHTSYLIMNYMDKDADIKVGDLIVSSGAGGIYPKGLPIGRVERVSRTGGFLKTAEIRPSVEAERLEEAFVIVGEENQ
jgi:rod shape-determining protein MreC